MVSSSSRRRAVKQMVEEGLGSAAQACRALGLARSSFYLASLASEERRQMQTQIIDLSQQHPRYGYRRVAPPLPRGGKRGNAQKVVTERLPGRLPNRRKQRRHE